MPAPAISVTSRIVACLCAEWCGTCREYQAFFLACAEKYPDIHFEWIDIEAQAEWVEDIEIENFPTLFVYEPDRICFFGTILPHESHLYRLLESLHVTEGRKEGAAVAGLISSDANVDALQRLGKHLLRAL